MKHIKKSILFFLLAALPAVAQQKLTLEDIWKGAFRTKGMDDLTAMENTNQYTVLNANYNTGVATIDLYDFATLNKVSTLADSKNLKELEGIDSYTFSPDEKRYCWPHGQNKYSATPLPLIFIFMTLRINHW